MEYDLERFKKFFKKGEQVCIGFRGGDTHGYISKFDENGIYLIQLNHATEYFYPWNKFEIITHAGVRFKNDKLDDFSNLVLINLIPGYKPHNGHLAKPQFGTTYEPANNTNSSQYLINFKREMFNYDVTDEKALETMKNKFVGKYQIYKSMFFGKATIAQTDPIFGKDHYKCVDDKSTTSRPTASTFLMDSCGTLCEAVKGCGTGVELDTNKKQLSLRGAYYNVSVDLESSILACGVGKDCGDIPVLLPYKINIEYPPHEYGKEYVISDKEADLGKELLRIVKGDKGDVKLKSYYIGDPYSSDDEMKMVDFKVWQTDQGYMFANKHAEIFIN